MSKHCEIRYYCTYRIIMFKTFVPVRALSLKVKLTVQNYCQVLFIIVLKNNSNKFAFKRIQ